MKQYLKIACAATVVFVLGLIALLGIGSILESQCEKPEVARNLVRSLDSTTRNSIVVSCKALARQAASTSTDLRFSGTGERRIPDEFSVLQADRLVVTKNSAMFVLQYCVDSGVILTISDLDKDVSKAELVWGDAGKFREAIQIQ